MRDLHSGTFRGRDDDGSSSTGTLRTLPRTRCAKSWRRSWKVRSAITVSRHRPFLCIENRKMSSESLVMIMWSSPERSSRMIGRSAGDRQQILCHVMRRKRHVILKPPGQQAENCSREKLHMHSRWKGEALIGRGQFEHFGQSLFCNIILDQLLKPANAFPTQHQLVEVLVFCHMLKHTNKIGRRMIRRERAGWRMHHFCHQSVIHLLHPLLKQGILILIMLVKCRAMNHGPLTDVLDGNFLEGSLGKFRHKRFPQQFVSASNP